MIEEKHLPSRIDFAMLSLLVAVGISLAALAYSFGGVDFGVYYAAGRVFLHGGNPYDYNQLAEEIMSSTGEMNNPYYYAPWFAWGMSLLAIFPYEIARGVWAAINFFLWFFGLFNLSKLIVWPPIGWRRWGMYLFATFLFAWATWGAEQVGILIFVILTAILLSYERGKFIPMGIWMALLLFKPNITAFPILALSVWLIFRKQWKPILSMAGMLVIMLAASLIISPHWYLALFQPDKITGLSYTLNESGEVQILRYTTTLLDWLATYGISGILAYVIYAIAALLGFFITVWAVYRKKSILRMTATVLLVNFALIPYALFYDYSALVLTLFFVNSELSAKRPLIWVQRGMNILLLLSLFIGNNITYRYWVVVILATSFFINTIHAASKNETARLK